MIVWGERVIWGGGGILGVGVLEYYRIFCGGGGTRTSETYTNISLCSLAYLKARQKTCYNDLVPDKNVIGQSTNFNIKTIGLYAITINATCQKTQDLRIEIDSRSFREIPPEKYIQKFNISPTWNGVKLKGKLQVNIFILNLEEGEHNLAFINKNGAEIIDWRVEKVDSSPNIVFDLNRQAKNLNRQPFLNIILIDLPLHSISADISLNWHKTSIFRGDGDDVKLIADNEVITDNKSQWLWRADKKQKNETKTQKRTMVANLKSGVHYLEFIGDKSPNVKQIRLNISEVDQTISYVGDFPVKPQKRTINGQEKAVLGIYKNGNDGKVFVPSNEKYSLYFNGKEYKTGDDLKGIKSWATIQFDLEHPHSEKDDWFYVGIDSTFFRLHSSDWNCDKLWGIYEK